MSTEERNQWFGDNAFRSSDFHKQEQRGGMTVVGVSENSKPTDISDMHSMLYHNLIDEENQKKKEFNAAAEHYPLWMNMSDIDINMASNYLAKAVEKLREHKRLWESSSDYRNASSRTTKTQIRESLKSDIS